MILLKKCWKLGNCCSQSKFCVSIWAKCESDPCALTSTVCLSVWLSVCSDSFIYKRLQQHGDNPETTAVTRAQLGGGELCESNHKKLAHCLQQIGDELDGHVELNRCDSFLKVLAEDSANHGIYTVITRKTND